MFCIQELGLLSTTSVEREYSLFTLLIFFVAPSARLDFKREKLNKRNNAPFHNRSGNEP